MCARWPTIAMSQILFWVWTKLLPLRGGDVMWFGVMCLWFDFLSSSDVASCHLICTTPVLLCTTKTYNVLLQYYSNVLLRSTTYYSRTTLYYKVLLFTEKYYASTTLHYNPVLRSPILDWRFIFYYDKMSRSAAPVTKSHPPTLPNTAPATQNHPPTSPNNAPVTQNQCHQWSASHMKPHFQCVEQVKSPSNLACHAKWMSSMICVTYETSFPMRGASEVTLQPHQILRLSRNLEAEDFSGYSLNASANKERRFEDNPRIIRTHPRIKSSSRTRRFGDLTRPSLETILYCKIQHFALRLSPKMSRSAAPVRKSHPPTLANTAPATQNQCHQWSASHMKAHFPCVEQVKSPSNLTKYCACHAKWMSSMICVTYETSFPMRGASEVTLQPHQILRLSRNLEAEDFSGYSLHASANRKTIRG